MDDIGLPLSWGIIPAQRYRRVVTGDDPAAGTEFTIAVPGGVVWRLRSLQVTFTTDANVATRGPALSFDDGTTEFARIGVGFGPVASVATALNWSLGLGSSFRSASGHPIASPLPDIWLLGGYRVRSITVSIQVGDNYGAPVVLVDEYEVRGLERALERYERAAAAALAGGG